MENTKINSLNLENQHITAQSEREMNRAKEGSASIETEIPDTSNIFNNSALSAIASQYIEILVLLLPTP